MMDDVIETRGLTKRYGDAVDGASAIDGLDLSVPRGSVFGLVGPNGAGKTTTLRLLLGLGAPTSGTARVLGDDSRRLSKVTRQRIGFLAESDFPYDDLAFADVLKFVSGFFETWDWSWCEHLIERLRVDKYKRLDRMSAGQRRVAELLLAVAHGPELLVLDDPAVGLDVTVRRELLWTLLETVQERGTTVLFSSHILQDVERVVDRVGILVNGKLRVVGEIEDVKARVRRLVLPAADAPAQVAGELSREQHGRELVVVTEAWNDQLAAELGASTGGRFECDPLTLEEIFLAVAREAIESDRSAR